MDHIKEHANINIPSSHMSKYQNLLLKHFSIVSINKSDLGRVRNFFHKIHLKDNEPVYRKQFKILDAHHPFLEESLADWLKLGVVQKSDSLYNSPVFCVHKKRRKWLQNCSGLQRTQSKITHRQVNNEGNTRMHWRH
jgi:hypothetical protein